MDPKEIFEPAPSGRGNSNATDEYLSGTMEFQDYMNFLIKRSENVRQSFANEAPGSSSDTLQTLTKSLSIGEDEKPSSSKSLVDLSKNHLVLHDSFQDFDDGEEEISSPLNRSLHPDYASGLSQDPDFESEEEPELVRLIVEPPLDESTFDEESGSFDDSDFEPYAKKRNRGKKADLPPKEADVLGIPNELQMLNDESQDGGELKRGRIRQLPETLESLMGHANITFAQGKRMEAVAMLEEVIRQQANAYEPYRTMSYFCHEMGDKDKELQYGLLGAYLDYLTDEFTWADLGHLAEELAKPDVAVQCYARAIKKSEKPWNYFVRRLDLLENQVGDSKRLMECKLDVVKTMARVPCDPHWYLSMADKFEKEFKSNGEYDGIFLCRFHSLEVLVKNGMSITAALADYVDILLARSAFSKAATACFTFANIKLYDAENLVVENISLEDPKSLRKAASFSRIEFSSETSDDLILKFVTSLVHCAAEFPSLINLSISAVRGRIDYGLEGYQGLCEALMHTKRDEEALEILSEMLSHEAHSDKVMPWFCYAKLKLAEGDTEEALNGFERVLEIDPQHVAARVALTDIQLQQGKTRDALITLLDFEGADNYILKDERLVLQECMVHHAEKRWEDFLKVGWRLMAPYFGEVYVIPSKSPGKTRVGLRGEILRFLKSTPLERFVHKSLTAIKGSKKTNERVLSATDIYNVCFKMCEVLFDLKRYWDMLLTAGYAAIQPRIMKQSNLAHQFVSISLLASLKSRQSKIAFQILRQYQEDSTRIWNMHGMVFSMSQDVSFHRFVLRKASSNPDSVPITIISGNSSLVSGTYIHALMEYLSALEKVPMDPLVNLMAGLCFIHLSCKKDITRRQELLYQGLAFVTQYEEIRGVDQEIWYNLGRVMHQINLLFAAIHYYKKVLEASPIVAESEGNRRKVYDLRPLAAYNLALIYRESGNTDMGRDIMEKYCIIE